MKKKQQDILVCTIAFTMMLVYIVINKEYPLYGDTIEIWNISKNLFNANAEQYRSYVEYRGFPIFIFCNVIYIITKVLNIPELLGLRVVLGGIFTIITAVSLPYLFCKIFNKHISILQKIGFILVMFYFYRGYFLYPLSDHLALLFAVLAINRIFHALEKPKVDYINYTMSGIYIALAFLTRSNYVIIIPCIILFIIYINKQNQNLEKKKMVYTIMAKVGSCIIGIIMIIGLNSMYGQIRNSIAGEQPLKSNNLLGSQLLAGITNQKIDWNTRGDIYAGPIHFIDPYGVEILKKEKINSAQKIFQHKNEDTTQPLVWSLSYSEYIKLVFKYPIDFICLYVKHLFNGLDITYPDVYIQNIRQGRFLFSLLNYTLMFLSFITVRRKFSYWWKNSKQTILVLFTLMSTVLPCIPAMVEPRFFMPLTIGLFGIAIFEYSVLKRILETIITSKGKCMLSWNLFNYIIFITICFTMSSYAFSQSIGELLTISYR